MSHRQQTKRAFEALAAILLVAVPAAHAVPSAHDAIGFERTPPRLSMIDGEVSFWRPGAEEWTQAQVNTPLAPGDQLYSGLATNLEIQIGPRAFLRAGDKTQFGLESLEPDYLQVRISEGGVALDVRELRLGYTLEVSTPQAAITIERPGYYRIAVDGDRATFTSRRGGNALVTPASGSSTTLANGEQVVIAAGDTATIAGGIAPELDAWDRWNYARSDRQANATSARHVSADVYGLADLDDHGDWRQEPQYGAVWVPRQVAVGWAPYSTGRWIHDPFFGWSWIDAAPWGWAPFHYGRWVHVSGVWGWCPGPVVVRPYYAPAMVAFFGGGGGISVGVSVGAPFGWVALGWGEPIVPWWGPGFFRGVPFWGGWGGPRYVNNVYVDKTTVINVENINVYNNTRVRGGVVVVDGDRFGRGRVDRERRRDFDPARMRPVRGDLPFRPSAESVRAGDRPGRRPASELTDRPVVSSRRPRGDRDGDRRQPNHVEARREPARDGGAGERPRRDGDHARRGDGRRDGHTVRSGAARPDGDMARRGDARRGDHRSDRRDAAHDATAALPERSEMRSTRQRDRHAAIDRPRVGTRGDRSEASRAAPERARPAPPTGNRRSPERPERFAAPRGDGAAAADASAVRRQSRRGGDAPRAREYARLDGGRVAPPPPPPHQQRVRAANDRPLRDTAPATRHEPRSVAPGSNPAANRDAVRSRPSAPADTRRAPSVAPANRAVRERAVPPARAERGQAPAATGAAAPPPAPRRAVRSHPTERRASASSPRRTDATAPTQFHRAGQPEARAAVRGSAQPSQRPQSAARYGAAPASRPQAHAAIRNNAAAAPSMRSGGGSAGGAMRGSGGAPGAMRGGTGTSGGTMRGGGGTTSGGMRGARHGGGDGRRAR